MIQNKLSFKVSKRLKKLSYKCVKEEMIMVIQLLLIDQDPVLLLSLLLEKCATQPTWAIVELLSH